MRRVNLGKCGIETSALGFGCASLGSRVAAAPGLRALAAAHESGVAWIDIAPAYGRGEAERLIGGFVSKNRSRIQICSKVGLAPPKNTEGATGFVASRVVPLARHIVSRVPGIRSALRRSRVQGNRKLPLTPELLQSSLERTLLNLQTDYVDLFALHNATTEEVMQEDLHRALEQIVSSGKARAVAVASDEFAADAAVGAAGSGGPYCAVQIAMPSPAATSAGAMVRAREAGLGVLVHSVMQGASHDLGVRLRQDVQAWAVCEDAAGVSDPMAVVRRVLVARALMRNASGVVVLSMFSPGNLEANLAVATSGASRWDNAILELERVARRG